VAGRAALIVSLVGVLGAALPASDARADSPIVTNGGEAPEVAHELWTGDPYVGVPGAVDGLVQGGDGASIGDFVLAQEQFGLTPSANIVVDAFETEAATEPIASELGVALGLLDPWFGFGIAALSTVNWETLFVAQSALVLNPDWNDAGCTNTSPGWGNYDYPDQPDVHDPTMVYSGAVVCVGPWGESTEVSTLYDRTAVVPSSWGSTLDDQDHCFSVFHGDHGPSSDLELEGWLASSQALWDYEAERGGLGTMHTYVVPVPGNSTCEGFYVTAPAREVLERFAEGATTLQPGKARGAIVVQPDAANVDPAPDWGAAIDTIARSVPLVNVLDPIAGTASTVTIPDCTGATWLECVAALRAAGVVGWIIPTDSGVDAPESSLTGHVFTTSPAAGLVASPSTVIEVELYRSPDGVPFPLPPASAPDDPTQQTTAETTTTTDGGGTAPPAPTESCSTVDPGTLDFGPFEGLDWADVFPFGIFVWVKNGVTGWTGTSSAPSFTLPLLGAGQGHPVPVDLSILDGFMAIFREYVLLAATFAGIWGVATGVLGFMDMPVGQQGSLF
jgi:hypothetical protein